MGLATLLIPTNCQGPGSFRFEQNRARQNYLTRTARAGGRIVKMGCYTSLVMDSDLLVELGAPFLAHVLASDGTYIQAVLGGEVEASWTDGQAAVLQEIRRVSNICQHQGPAEQRGALITDIYGQFPPDRGTTIGNILRGMAGGDITASPVIDDPMSVELTALARDCYPLLLLPSNPRDPFSGGINRLSVSIFHNPHHKAFAAAVMADATLARLFPDEREHAGRIGYTSRSTGQAGTIQLSMLATQLLTAGWELALLESATPCLAEYLAATEKALDIARNALSGKHVEVPVRVGLTGVLLPIGTKIDLGWAQLRPADDRDEYLAARSGIDGSVQATTSSGELVPTVRYSGDTVMEMLMPYSVVARQFMPERRRPIDHNGWDQVEEKLENIRLGLLLAIDESPRALVLPTWRFVIDPLGNTSYSWNDWRRTSFSPRALDVEAVVNWKQWNERIAAKRKSGIDISVRRALLAAAERQSPEDVLVDAVVVWENLFGSNQDTTIRVTGALAWLLAMDVAGREQKQRRLKEIYQLRSNIVHGAHQMTTQEMQTCPQEALDVALEALRRIFEVRPDLIDLEDGNARSNRMLLGG